MPYEWVTTPDDAPAPDAPGVKAGAAPLGELHAWPFRSLPKRGAAAAIGGAYALFLIPISAFVGTKAVWWLLIPGLIAIYGLWWFIDRSYKDGEILETLELWPDHIRLTRDGPHNAHALWEANPYWVSVHLRGDGPVPAYLTLKGGGREVELGRFLTESERRALHSDITLALARVKSRAKT